MAARKRRQSKSEKIIISVVIAIILLVSAVITYFPQLGLPTWSKLFYYTGVSESTEVLAQPFTVHFIDVGQGDCILLKTENGAILIDTGNSGDGEKVLSYLSSLNIKSIDYLILTHPHSDHIGGAVEIIDGITVKNIIMPRLPKSITPTTNTYTNLLKKISEKNIYVYAAVCGDKYSVEDCYFTVLAPVSDASDLNDMSVVIRAVYGETSFLFQGDAESYSENLILENGIPVDSDVIKIGHHGSSSSSTEDYIKAVSPKFAVISCGKDNSFGHPHNETITLLNKLGIDYARTDASGTIVVGSDKKTLYCNLTEENV